MFPLFESIKLQDGIPQHIEYHQARYERSFREYFGHAPAQSLTHNLYIPPAAKSGIYKLRIAYNAHNKSYDFEPYTPKKIKTLKLIHDNNIDYHLKFSNRNHLNRLYAQRGDCDDILIIKNGLVTDTSYANIVFFDGVEWVTPAEPLLRGTFRERLVARGVLRAKEIFEEDIWGYRRFGIVNGMLGFGEKNSGTSTARIFK